MSPPKADELTDSPLNLAASNFRDKRTNIIRRKCRRAWRAGALTVFAVAAALPSANAQTAWAAQYFYDAAGRLQAVIDPGSGAGSGAAIYKYDQVGNVTNVTTFPSNTFLVANATPAKVATGHLIQVGGWFGSTATTANVTVFINGTTAPFASVPNPVTPTALQVIVPSAATSGTITVNSPAGNGAGPAVVSETVFNVIAPVVSSIPATAMPGSSITVGGTNFDSNVVNDRVTVNGQALTVTSATASQIVATMPIASAPGPVTVETTAGPSAPYGLLLTPLAGATLSQVAFSTSFSSFTLPSTGNCQSVTGSFNSSSIAWIYSTFSAKAGTRVSYVNTEVPQNGADYENVMIYEPSGAQIGPTAPGSVLQPSAVSTTLPVTGTYTLAIFRYPCLFGCTLSPSEPYSASICSELPASTAGPAIGNGSSSATLVASNPGENASVMIAPSGGLTTGEGLSYYILPITGGGNNNPGAVASLSGPSVDFQINAWNSQTAPVPDLLSLQFGNFANEWDSNLTEGGSNNHAPLSLPYLSAYNLDVLPIAYWDGQSTTYSLTSLGTEAISVFWYSPLELTSALSDIANGGSPVSVTNNEPGQGFHVVYSNPTVGAKVYMDLSLVAPTSGPYSGTYPYISPYVLGSTYFPLNISGPGNTSFFYGNYEDIFCNGVSTQLPAPYTGNNGHCYMAGILSQASQAGLYTLDGYVNGSDNYSQTYSYPFAPIATLNGSLTTIVNSELSIQANGVAVPTPTTTPGEAVDLNFGPPALNGFPQPVVSALYCFPSSLILNTTLGSVGNDPGAQLVLSGITQGQTLPTLIDFGTEETGIYPYPNACFYLSNEVLPSSFSSFRLTVDLGVPFTGSGGNATLYSIAAPPAAKTIGTKVVSQTTTSLGQAWQFSFNATAGSTVALSFAVSSLPNPPWADTKDLPNANWLNPEAYVYDKLTPSTAICELPYNPSAIGVPLTGNCVLPTNTSGNYIVLIQPQEPIDGTISASPPQVTPGAESILVSNQTQSVLLSKRAPGAVSFFAAAGQRMALLVRPDKVFTNRGQCYRVTLSNPIGNVVYDSQDKCEEAIFSGAISTGVNPTGSDIGLAMTGVYTARVAALGSAIGQAKVTLYAVGQDPTVTVDRDRGVARVRTSVSGEKAVVNFHAARQGQASISVTAQSEQPVRQCRRIRVRESDGTIIKADLVCGNGYSASGLRLPQAGDYRIEIVPTGTTIGSYLVQARVP